MDDRSANVLSPALAPLGESWDHNHHAFPRSASHGPRWFELDLSGLAIELMARTGLAGNVVRIPPERQSARLVEPATHQHRLSLGHGIEYAARWTRSITRCWW